MKYAPSPHDRNAARRKRRAHPAFRPWACEPLESRLALSASPLYPTALDNTPGLVIPLSVPAVTTLDDGGVVPLATSSPTGRSPTQLRQWYGYDQISFAGGTVVGNGAGQTIAIVNAFHTANAFSDLQAFCTQFSLPMPPSFTQVGQTGGATPAATDANWALETALDVQWVHAFAPAANILLVEATSSGWTDMGAAIDYARGAAGVSVVSMSWGGSESSPPGGFDSHFVTTAGHQDVAFVAAAGNFGSPGVYPAYSASVMAVGGTTLILDGSNNITGETAWSRGGGGLSTMQVQPSWQNGVVTQSSTFRAMPDVSFEADPNTGVPVYNTFGGASPPWNQVGGTSFATPSWAALVAIADQGRNLAGLATLGIPSLMSKIYTMPATNFNDITTGASNFGSVTQNAAPGYDLVTGRGTPKGQLVVQSLVGLGSISGTVYDDLNANGVNNSEPALANWTVYADLNANGVLDPLVASSINSVDVPKSISNLGTPTVTSNTVVSGLAGRVVDVNVTVNISHGRDSDLVLTLISPSNTRITLANRAGGVGDNFAITHFDDSQPLNIAAGTAPFNASFHPTDELWKLIGENANGTWKLEIKDALNGTGGTLNSWSLQLTTGDPNDLTDASGSYSIAGLPAGSYQVREVLQAPYTQTAPAAGFYTVGLAAGESALAKNFGNSTFTAAAEILDRRLFYNQSAWDGDSAGINFANDAQAIAPDKVAYLPGDGAATAVNITNYSRGINGLIIDLTGTGNHANLSAGDFVFKMSDQSDGNSNNPESWGAAPNPLDVQVSIGGGVSASDRVEIVWNAGDVINRWLMVQVKANGTTGLDDTFGTIDGNDIGDIFFFGNKAGDANQNFGTNAGDNTNVLANLLGPGLATITNTQDVNRSKGVNAGDGTVVVNNSGLGALTQINIGMAGPFGGAGGGGGGGTFESVLAAESQTTAYPATGITLVEDSLPGPQPAIAGAEGEVVQPAVEHRAAGSRGAQESAHRLAAAVAAWRWSWGDTALPGQGTIAEDLLDVLVRGRTRSAWHRA